MELTEVYDLYDLTDEEISIIDEEISIIDERISIIEKFHD
jgi:hypothetical protein